MVRRPALLTAWPFLFATVASAALAGCGGGLALTPIRATQSKPSNVAVYFKVRTTADEPVAGLAAESFKIYEDGSLVSQYESKQTILNPEVAAAHYTLLLVDMSGSVTESGSAESVVEAASTFTTKVEKQQRVGVFAFDGSPEIHAIVPFTSSAGGASAGVRALGTFKPKDPSTNLNGAVAEGIALLERELARAPQPLRFGTLVVFTDGTDRAGRVTAQQMRESVKKASFDVFAIGLGAEIQESQLRDVGKSGTVMAKDRDAVAKAFETIAAKIEGSTKSYYLLSYCSPARAGQHEVRIEAIAHDAASNRDRSGSLTSRFDATGFGPNCDPTRPPNFDVTKGDALAPPPPAAETKPMPAPARPTPAKPRAPAQPAPTPPPTKPAEPVEEFNP